MRTRARIVVAIGWSVAVIGALLVFIVRAGSGFTTGGASIGIAGLTLAIASDATVGAVLMIRRPRNVIGRLLMAAAILTAITLLGWVSGAALAEARGRHDFGAGVASLIGGLGFTPSLVVAGPLLALLFPSGRLPSARWKWPVRAIVVAIAVGSASAILHPGPIPASLADNPFGASAFSGSEAFWTIGIALVFGSLPVAFLLAIAAVIVRFRRAEGVERAQLKWFVAANVALAALLILGFADGGYLGLAAGTSPTFLDILAYVGSGLPPIAVGVAILRYRLFEIDRIISRTLAWAVLTGLLGAVFVGLVVGLQAVTATISDGNALAVAASTLIVAVLFQPLRRLIQGAVDRMFNRAHYDAEQTVAGFSARLRDDVDLETIQTDLRATVQGAIKPMSLGLWIRGGAR